ncbi:MAG: DEAD/DEAH box helicase [Candidatus Buchananbacteria bacterium]|nr:DEAD/DEAH box helicase [Candidatus Buchananbacteria bacterium]
MAKQSIEKQPNSLSCFIKEVGGYFMEFLETDFHKRKLPRRSVKLHNDKGLLTGINLSKYPSFYKVAYKLVNNCFNSDILSSVQKSVYKADIPKSLLDLIKKQIAKVSESDIVNLIKDLDESIKQSALKYSDDYLQAFNCVMADADKVFKKRIVLDLVKSLEKSLDNNKLADENAIFQIEEELTEILKMKISDSVSEAIRQKLSGEKSNTKKLLIGALNLNDVCDSLTKFFDMFKVSDLFNDLHELYQNFKTEDKQEFYFYFYDISYQKNKYPIFYIPFSIERKSDIFYIIFDSQIYINKKALAYIAQEYNLERDKKGSLQTIAERIIYLADHKKDLHLVLQETLTDITNFFNLDGKIQVSNPDIQATKNLYVSVSSNVYVALFDKSDEALLNDYEDILNAPEGSSLMNGFQILIDDFIHKNPESVNMVIIDEWDEKNIDERLVCKSPIPLNSEQQQILSAINNDKCKYLLVEGPPGTGKSHTITAIVFDTILKDKSVLVLSDKKEALDVVEKNIVNTLNKVRVDEKFQNPLLRLGKTGNTYSQLLTQSSIAGITEQFRAVRSKYPNLNEQIDTAIAALRNGVEDQVSAYNKISINEINELVLLKKHFDHDGLCIDIDEAVKNTNSVEELIKIRSILLKIKEKIQSNRSISFNFDFKKELNIDNSKNLEEVITDLIDMKRIIAENSQFQIDELFTVYQPLIKSHESIVSELLGYLTDIFEIVDILDGKKEYISILGVRKNHLNSLEIIREVIKFSLILNDVVKKSRYYIKDDLSLLNLFNESHSDDLASLDKYIKSAKELKGFLFGYFGKTKQIEKLNQGFLKKFVLSNIENPHKKIKELETIMGIYKYILELKVESDLSFFDNIDFIFLVTSILKNKDVYLSEDQLSKLNHLTAGLSKAEILTEKLREGSINILTLKDLNCLSVVYELNSLYENIIKLISEESDLINANINLKKDISIDVLLQTIFLKKIIEGISVCKEYVDSLIEIDDDINYLRGVSCNHESSFTAAGINDNLFKSLCENKLTSISDLEFEKLVRLISIHQDLISKFDEIKDLNYGDRTRQIENIVTMQMTYLMDERFVGFTNDYKGDAKALKQVIKDKKKFPKEQFIKLKSAFPCILSGIRDYAEYIPLEPEIFDLVVIDEASQVSIAQAFPALLRAKKVVVLGDSLQFSNVKSALARGDINKQYLSNLKDVFLNHISSETDKVVRLEKFNIKVSILDFFGFINNYQIRLVKHFRGYRELISYSNKYFYKGSLQVMKVRGVSINSVIKFSQIKHDGLEEIIKNTNTPEVDYIILQLIEIKNHSKKCTVGIITPHTNQQQLLYKKISDLPEADYLFDILKLKIMTFDTCQGEEMDIIFYSMVATLSDDKLNYVFISDLNSIDQDDDEGKIKAQRLNVGLSRAKECMHFVLSKPIDQYSGTTKEFLQHYSNILIDGQKELDSSAVDKKSAMEPLVLDWFYQTKFWEENKDSAEILPQFKLGVYLKQLDKSYNHPNYRVDFLLIYDDNDGKQYKIIIEYDGFLEHFGDYIGLVNESNYQEYYSPEDVYRQYILESYGYKFIRINKFNLGENPISTLDSRIYEIVKKKL